MTSPDDAARGYRLLATLALVAVAAWAWLTWDRMGGGMAMAGLTMGLRLGEFLVIWVVMMVAMMVPTAAPMVLTFHRIQSRKTSRGRGLDTWVFVGGYLLLWAITGLAAYALARAAEAAATSVALSPNTSARLGGAILVLAGLYQVTPLKDVCLSTCRTPISFIMTSWRPGIAGAFWMGWRHGLYCFGCCWLLFAILFPLGMMNIVAMAAITLLIFAEKSLPGGRWTARIAAGGLVIYGVAVIAMPPLLPTFAAASMMDMTMPMSMKMAAP